MRRDGGMTQPTMRYVRSGGVDPEFVQWFEQEVCPLDAIRSHNAANESFIRSMDLQRQRLQGRHRVLLAQSDVENVVELQARHALEMSDWEERFTALREEMLTRTESADA